MPEITEDDRVTLDQATETLLDASGQADEREEMTVDWTRLLPLPTSTMSLDTFRPHVGEVFEIALGQFDAQVELIEVRSLGEAPSLGKDAPTKEHFHIVFRGNNRRSALPEGWYRLRHRKLHEFEVYLEPTHRVFHPAQHATPHLKASFT